MTWPDGLELSRRADADTAALAALFNQADFQHNGSTLEPFSSLEDASAFFGAISPQAFDVTARIGRAVVGYAGVYPAAGRQRHTGSLTLCVDHAHQRQGIGSILVASMITTAWVMMELSRLQLTVFVDNARAISLYERLGFETEGRIRNFVRRPDGFVDAYLMALMKP